MSSRFTVVMTASRELKFNPFLKLSYLQMLFPVCLLFFFFLQLRRGRRVVGIARAASTNLALNRQAATLALR
jgi:hypothetical protein